MKPKYIPHIEDEVMKNKFRKSKDDVKGIILKGDAIESFERVERITEVILLGEDGGVRRIIL